MRSAKVLLCVSIVAVILVCSCSTAPATKFEPVPAKGSAKFTRQVIDKQTVSIADGIFAAFILTDRYEPGLNPKEQLDILVKEGLLPRKWQNEISFSEPLTRGKLAYLLVNVLKVSGGLTVKIFGYNDRYALRECIERKLIEKGSTNTPVSGRELISILANAEKYKIKSE